MRSEGEVLLDEDDLVVDMATSHVDDIEMKEILDHVVCEAEHLADDEDKYLGSYHGGAC